MIRSGPRPRATMKDVATLAGVSLKTVSRVVNDEGGVCDDLVARVRKAADQLDFRPHLGASTLRRTDGKTRTIGLLVHDVANSFYSALHRGVEDVAWERGVQVLTASVADDPDRERGVILGLTARRVDGIIVTPTHSDHGTCRPSVAPEPRSCSSTASRSGSKRTPWSSTTRQRRPSP